MAKSPIAAARSLFLEVLLENCDVHAIYPFKLSLEEFLDIREKNDGGLKK